MVENSGANDPILDWRFWILDLNWRNFKSKIANPKSKMRRSVMDDTAPSSTIQLPWESIQDAAPAEQSAVLGRPIDPEADARPMVLLADSPPPPQHTGSAWTIPLMCLGIALIACCVLIPLCDETRRLAYERQRLKQELSYVTKQVAVNDAFLKKVARDPTLAERLAQRQMKVVPAGTAVLNLGRDSNQYDDSPFQLVHLAPPAALAPYQSPNDLLSRLCLQPKSQLYLLGAAMLMVAASLVLGGPKPNFALAAEQEE
jgi:hypothetical protein